MAFGAHREMVSEEFISWENKTNTEANSLLVSLAEYDFIVTFGILYTLLSGLEGITNKLQKKGLDVYEAHNMVNISQHYYLLCWYYSIL